MIFARNFVKHPNMLGVPLPSSRFLVERVLKHVRWGDARTIVEYGPGAGTFTAEMLARMRPDARLLAIDTNRDFVRFLRERFAGEDRLEVALASAERVREEMERLEMDPADYVISGVPMKPIPPDVRERIVKATRDALAPNGRFLVYQFWSTVRPHLEAHFRDVREEVEPRNLLPMRVFVCRP